MSQSPSVAILQLRFFLLLSYTGQIYSIKIGCMSENLLSGPFEPPLQSAPSEVIFLDARVACGFPSPAADYEESSLDLNAFVVQNRAATFFFTVSGCSMANAGILDGDRVAVDRSITPRHGHIVVAVVNHEYTIKRLHMLGGAVELHAEHEAYPPIRFKDGEELCIWGVVTAVIRKLRV